MEYPVSLAKIDESVEFYAEIKELQSRAKNYLLEYEWCKEVYNGWLFTNIGYVLGVFLFEIENTASPEDKLLWVVTGDFPAVYLDTINCVTTKEAVENYIRLAVDWLDAVENNRSTEECFPFEIPEGKEYIELFKSKVSQLNTLILPNIIELNYKLAL